MPIWQAAHYFLFLLHCKTTLAEALALKLGLPVHYEPVIDNVYLKDFYEDMSKYAFPLQIFLLNKRFKQQQQIVW
jgi:deoxyadenosine/deoxycytidine kinase